MSKAEILAELPKLENAERREIFERICELEDRDLINGDQNNAVEKALLDEAIEEFEQNPDAGSSWEQVEARLRQKQTS